jgi:hypothetical protein
MANAPSVSQIKQRGIRTASLRQATRFALLLD